MNRFDVTYFNVRMDGKEGKDLAYFERDQLVAALSKLFPSYLAKHPDDPEWEEKIITKTKRTGEIYNIKICIGDIDLIKNCGVNEGYARNKNGYIHTQIAERLFKHIPDGYEVDHIDTNRLNNSRFNLRLSTKRGQMLNTTRKLKGYEQRTNNRWRSYACIDGKKITLGNFDTEEEAKKVSETFRELLLKASDKDGTYIYPEKPYDLDWMNIVYINLPTGQISYHIHDSELIYFKHLKYEENTWDGHSNPEKYKRLANINAFDFKPFLDFGDLFPLEEFVKNCEGYNFTDYDGHGYYATETKETNLRVECWKLKEGIIDHRFTHVKWYNK